MQAVTRVKLEQASKVVMWPTIRDRVVQTAAKIVLEPCSRPSSTLQSSGPAHARASEMRRVEGPPVASCVIGADLPARTAEMEAMLRSGRRHSVEGTSQLRPGRAAE